MKDKDEDKKAVEEHATVVNSNNWMSGRQEIHQIERREIWTQQAAIFIEQVNVCHDSKDFFQLKQYSVFC